MRAASAEPPRRFELTVSPTRATTSDIFTVTVRIEVVGVGGPERYYKPGFRDFEVVDSRVHRSQSLSADPKSSLVTSELYIYKLRPKRTGRLVIDAARIRVGGKEYKTRRKSVAAVAGSAGALTSDPGGDPLIASGMSAPGFTPPIIDRTDGAPAYFIHVVADNLEPYVGEQVTVSWLLYTLDDVTKLEIKRPRLDSLWAELLYETSSKFTYIDTRVDGEKYYLKPLVKQALFATKSGRLRIPPMTGRIATPSSPRGRLARIESKDLVLTVKPLPENAPPGFDPAYVGVFEVAADLDRTALDADESLTLELTVRAEGAVRRTSAPKLRFDGFNFREPRDFEETQDTSSDILRGTRIYRYWTTPQRGGAQELPAIQVPFFNPRTERYEVASTNRIPIVVRGDPTAASQASGERRIDRNIRLIVGGDSIASRVAQRWYASAWFWLFCALPLGAFLAVAGTDRIRQRMRRETPRARIRRARGKAKQRFRVAEIHLRGNRPAKFFGELSHILYEHLEEQLGNPVQSMTRDELAAYLRERGFASNTVRRITTDLDLFDMARFAPSATANEEMRAALRRVKSLLREIEQTGVRVDYDSEDEA